MLIGYKRGQGSVILRVKILNSSVSTGAGLTGLSSTSSGLIISTIADTESTATAYTVAASNVETITTNGTFAAPTSGKCRFKEVDATNHKGVYEIQIADARFAVSGAKFLLVSISGATNCAETDIAIPLRDLDPYDAVRGGLTALPNAAAEASGGLITRGTGTGQLSVSSGAVTVGTNNDKTGYSLTQSFPSNFASLAITAGGSVTAGTVSDKTGYSLSSSQTFSTTGSVGSVTARVNANTEQLAGQTVTAAAGVTFPTTVSSLTAANVWQTDISGYTTAGQAGTALKGAGSAGDPWSTALPGSYTAGSAGYIVGTNLNATVSSRMATYTQPTGFLAATFPTTVASPTNITSASGIVLAPTTHTGAVIPRVTLVDTTTTNTDMRGTDGAALASLWTSTRAGYLDAAVSSRMATFALPTHFADLEIAANGHVSAAVQSVANNSITASAIQGGAITAAKFAAGAIDANALATDAVTEIVGGVLTTAMTESYRSAGASPTLAQTAFELLAHMGDSSISDTTKTLRKLDGTTAKTFTLDSATTPTSITEAT